ncbi:hypothetical protein [Rubrobacter calidifluminis]|uniref:hypothetical protein n=1 Tax=Rubrobacter calidifluminis TaxID=1392640 RepID=UPI0023613E0F|nr:hypothetical protein [Rubrobacter calidifluminis]
MGERRKTIEHNARATRRYLDIWPLLAEPGRRGEEKPLSRKERGSSRPPVSARLLAFLSDEEGRDASRILSPLLEELMHSGISYGGIPFRDILFDCLREPTGVKAIEEDPRKKAALDKLCLLVAHQIAAGYGPERRIHVRIPRKDESFPSMHAYAMRKRTWRKEDAYRALSEAWLEKVLSGMAEREAYRAVSEERGVSYWQVWRAVAWAKEDAS